MQTYSRQEVVEITKPDPNWMNFDEKIEYEKNTIPLSDAVKTLYTVFDDIEDFERISFVDYAKAFKENRITDIPEDRLQKIRDLYESKYTEPGFMIPCLKCGDLKQLLPEEYPAWIETPDKVYITEDRNHRMVALALRLLDGEEIGDIPISVFYGHLVR